MARRKKPAAPVFESEELVWERTEEADGDDAEDATYTATATTEPGYVCPDCGHATTDEPESPLYECCNTYTREGSADGDSTRCPDCNKFGAKVAPWACPECEAGIEEVSPVVTCDECSEVVAADDWQQHMTDNHPDAGEAQ